MAILQRPYAGQVKNLTPPAAGCGGWFLAVGGVICCGRCNSTLVQDIHFYAKQRRIIAAVLYPSLCSTSIAPSGQHAFLSKYVHGIWNTVPMLTRLALRYNGSAQAGVKRTASIPSAAAERKIAPTFVGFTTFSKIATRLAFLQSCSTEGSVGRYMAQSMPRVS